MRVIFMGTPDFAVPCLERLIATEEVVGVFTQPDKPKGRKYELAPPPVKVCAVEHGIPVFQPATMKDGTALEIIRSLDAELIIVVAFGKILTKDILESVKYGCINIHASLLPKYRGAAPIQWAVINGEKKSGVTSMQMDEGLDTGDMLLSESINIDQDMTGGELHDALSLMGAEVMENTIKLLKENKLTPVRQGKSTTEYAKMLTKDMCPVDFYKNASEVHNQIRGMSPWPVATTTLNGKTLKLHKSRMTDRFLPNYRPGSVHVTDHAFYVVCGDRKMVEILEVQEEGKKRMHIYDFLRGHRIEEKTVLGE